MTLRDEIAHELGRNRALHEAKNDAALAACRVPGADPRHLRDFLFALRKDNIKLEADIRLINLLTETLR